MLEISQLRNQLTAAETRWKNAETSILALQARVDTLENNPSHENFRPDVTVIVTGLRYAPDEDVMNKATSLIHEGLELSHVRIVNATRTPFRGDKPGIVKIQLNSVDDKIRVLREKRRLLNDDRYKNVFIRGSQSHEERLLQLNTDVILREMGIENRYRRTGSGRLVPKDDYQLATGGPHIITQSQRPPGPRPGFIPRPPTAPPYAPNSRPPFDPHAPRHDRASFETPSAALPPVRHP